MNHGVLRKVGIIAGWLAAWQVLALVVHNSIMLVGPIETIGALLERLPEAEFWSSIGATFVRIVGGFLLGSLLGILLALLAYRKPLLKDILAPFVGALKTVPVASFIILALIWVGSGNVSMFISFIVVFPMLYLNTLEGLQSLDQKLLEMADVYRIPFGSRLKYIYIPGVYPFLVSAFQLALGMSWKSGVAAEVIGQPLQSIGNHLYLSKIQLDTAGLLAWTLVIILLSWAFEKIFLLVLTRGLGSAARNARTQEHGDGNDSRAAERETSRDVDSFREEANLKLEESSAAISYQDEQTAGSAAGKEA